MKTKRIDLEISTGTSIDEMLETQHNKDVEKAWNIFKVYSSKLHLTEYQFKTMMDRNIEEQKENFHPEFVDLGLPSGVKWAKCNIGANSEEEYGEYLNYDDACRYFENREDKLPTKEAFNELLNCTIQEVVYINGVKGTKFTSKTNGNYIFIPFAGYCYNDCLTCASVYSYLWSSSININFDGGWNLCCGSDNYCDVGGNPAHYKFSVRAINS